MLRILLVEDDPGEVRLLRELLRQGPEAQVELAHAARLDEACRRLATSPTDLVLLDLSLPDSQGLATVTRVVQRAPDVPIVVLTGLRDERVAEDALRAGAQEFLIKGDISSRALERVIRSALERKGRENEQRSRESTLALLHRLVLLVGGAEEFNQALALVLEEVCHRTGWVAGEAWFPDRTGERLVRGPSRSEGGVDLQRFHAAGEGVAFAAGEGLPGRVWASRQPLWVPDTAEDPDITRAVHASEAGLSTAAVIPVLDHEYVAAVLAFYHTEARGEDEQLIVLVAAAAAQLGTLLQRRRAEDELAASERRYRRMVQGLQDGVLICDGQKRIVDVADRLCAMLGYTVEEMLDLDATELLDPEELAQAPLRWPELQRRGNLVTERVLRRKDGTRFPAEISSALLGEGRIECVVRDITDRKRAEVLERLLAEASEVYAASLDSRETVRRVSGLLVPRLADWCVVNVLNEAGEPQVVEIVASDARKHTLLRRMLEQFPHSAGAESHPVARVLHTGEPVLLARWTSEMFAEMGITHEQEEFLHLLDPRSSMVVPLTARGRVLGAMVLTVSESGRSYGPGDLPLVVELARRAALAIDNARLYEQATRAARAREEVLSFVAHDLRNPLAAVAMLADSFAEPDLQQDMRLRMARTLQRAASQMDRLIEDLLDVTRLETGRLTIEPTAVAVRPLLSETRELNQRVAERKGLSLEIRVVGSPPDVHAERARVLRVLSNLVGNALKFTSTGGTVTLLAETRGDEVILGVRDTGTGITSEQMPHLFDRFWQAERKRGSGVGLGLVIAKGLVEAHGGSIWVESEPGQGSTFWFTLPAVATGEAVDVQLSVDVVPAEPPPILQLRYPLRIVLADDHALFLSSLGMLLDRDARFDVIAKVGTGEQAVERARSLQPDLVLMDLEMPGIGGIEATRQVVALGQPTRVLVLTATTEHEHLLPALDAGASGFIRKSAQFDEVAEAIEAAVRGGLALATVANRLLLERFRELKLIQAESPLATVSETERTLLGLAAQGYTSAEIGKRLFLAPTTVDSYRSRLMRRLRLAHRADLVRFALKHGLLKAG
jgi:PAS domain S-box-containing protein